MILGNEVHSVIILGGVKKPENRSFVSQETGLGRVVSEQLSKGKKGHGGSDLHERGI